MEDKKPTINAALLIADDIKKGKAGIDASLNLVYDPDAPEGSDGMVLVFDYLLDEEPKPEAKGDDEATTA